MNQLAVMLLVFVVATLPGLASRRMERSDLITLIAIPFAMFPVAVLPSIITLGFNKDTATYLLGICFVAVVATVNYRTQPGRRGRPGSPERSELTTAGPVKEG